MADHCDDLVDLRYRQIEAVYIQLTDESLYNSHMACSFAFRAPPGQRLTMVIESIDVDAGVFHCADFLSVLDGEFDSKIYVPGMFSCPVNVICIYDKIY